MRLFTQTFVTVLIMLTSIAKAFGMDRGPSTQMGATRSVNISGNVLTFAMPENFSRDMPAEDLVTQLNINESDFGQNQRDGQLIRRWWDIKEPGFFGKELGTVMMNIAVHSVPKNERNLISDKPFDIREQLDFIMMIDEFLYWRHQELNADLEIGDGKLPPYTYPSFSMLGNEVQAPFWDHLFNGQNWIRFGSGGPRELLSTHYVIPLADKAFIEVSFYFTPNNGVFPRDFRSVAYNTTDPVLDSLYIEYAEGNRFRTLVGGEWPKRTVDDVIQQNRDLIVPLFDLEPGEKVPDVKMSDLPDGSDH